MVPEPRDGSRGDEYLSYMLRLWQESVDEPVEVDVAPVWRASLTSPMTGERLGFATLDDLIEYLHHQLDASAAQMQREGERGGDDRQER